MPPGRKQGEGCWTCRLRRKRCDSVRPVCGSCQSLHITCYSNQSRPPWMDGGAGQKHMSEAIKRQVKQNALLRRGRRYLVREDYSTILATGAGHGTALSSPAASFASGPIVENDLSTDSINSAPSTISAIPSVLQSSLDRSEEFQHSLIVSATPESTAPPIEFPPDSTWPAGYAQPIQVQLGSVMIYLDHVSPFLFPFYRPPLIETGRQWLLGLLCQNETSFHLAASVSAYFFALVRHDDEQDLHDECKALVRDRLDEQMALAVKSIQGTVSAVSCNEPRTPLLDRVRIMEEIIQLLVVEVMVRSSVNWKIHLRPAVALFDEMFKSHGIGMNHSEPSLAVLSSSLPSSIPATTPHRKSLPNTADQSALLFFISFLLFVDVVASTADGTQPALQSYHRSLLSDHDGEKCRVRLEGIVGCQNWVFIVIGNISALCAWKREAKQNSSFSVVDFISLATPISQALEAGFSDLEVGESNFEAREARSRRLDDYYCRHGGDIGHTSIINTTRVWAYAAKIYLSVSLSGWQTKSNDIQASVTEALRLLQAVKSPAELRSLSWPLCVAGCLASQSQEEEFRGMIMNMGQLGEFGTLLNTLRIMEAVWKSRDTIDGNTWDIALSLNVFDSPALLI